MADEKNSKSQGDGKAKSTRAPKKTGKRSVLTGQIHIFATFNNTIVTVTDGQGNTISWASAGLVGFKGSRKSTPFASRLATERAVKAAQDMGMQEVELFVKGPGPGRESAVRAVQTMGMRVRSISDVTPLPHNGCRPPKRRRM
ncbi:MAG: 30S ribosomal protein S11 [Anaerolineales bacterium]|nr:30S ribosomal protein S11 [Anaerolineales bacterium]MBX3004219.1 30S ribosomal protein S11 [Anaerolineales bacterium]